MIKANKIDEAGYNVALLGFGMAMKPRSAQLNEWWNIKRQQQVQKTAIANAGRGKGHDKFLRMIQTWWHLDMTRFLSQEFATYKIGTTTSSASTMHRLCYEPLTINSFFTDALDYHDIVCLQQLINRINRAINNEQLLKAKSMLPESYMLEQIWNANYAVLNCIIAQRHNHRMSGWQHLIQCFYDQVDHPELLIRP